MKPKLYILAGANGSGKSTISKVLLPAEGIVYINPDDIARELNPENPVGVHREIYASAIDFPLAFYIRIYYNICYAKQKI